jgi:dihydropyrimidinase
VTSPLDLAIRGGSVVTVAGKRQLDVGVKAGLVVKLERDVRPAIEEVDARGLLVIPGGIDMHVHLSPSPRRQISWVDDFASGSRAAAAGGITTVGNMSWPRRNEGLAAAMSRLSAEAESSSIVDFVLHPVLPAGSTRDRADLGPLAEAGYGSIKLFMLFPEFDRNVSAFLDAMSIAAELGMVVMIHCEDGAINAFVGERLVREGAGSLGHYAASRLARSESAAVARAAAMCEATGASTYVVHVSSDAALAEIRRARAVGLPMYAETRPLYLYFTEETLAGPDGGLYIGSPPLRTAADQLGLWDGLRSGDVQTCCSDHAAWKRADKLDPDRDVRTALPGVPDLETLMPLLFSEGVLQGRLSMERFVAVTSTNAARIFGIYPQKGTIAVGSDADLVVWDPALVRIVRAAEGLSRCDYSPYEGREVTGWPRHTFRRGHRIFSDGRVTDDAGPGRRVRRRAASSVGIT